MNDSLKKLEHGIIVSCQSEGEDPFNADPMYMALFAKAAEMGGAVGIRTEGVEKLMAIKQMVSLPIIGLLKTSFPDGTVQITGSMKNAKALLDAGCDILAIDGTFREREGLTGPAFIKMIKHKYDCLVLADIATVEEAKACELAGADAVSTTLNGYTPDTLSSLNSPNLHLLEQVVKSVHIPVFAEGNFNVPDDAQKAIRLGAFAVIVGTAITRPRVITQWFAEAVRK